MVENSKTALDIYLKTCEMISAEPKKYYALKDSKNGLLSAYRTGGKPIMISDIWQTDEEIMKVIVAKYGNLEQVP